MIAALRWTASLAARLFVFMWLLHGPASSLALGAELIGTVVDSETGRPLPARVYVQAADGSWRFVESATESGSALPYREQWVPMPQSVEQHTTISAHPFRVELPEGTHTITIERGKEYHSLSEQVSIAADSPPLRRTFRLRRWVDLAERGWYSGETHVHRRISELPNVMLAEDLNVAFPVTFWTIEAGAAPGLEPSPLRRQGPSPFGPREDRGSEMIQVDSTHVMFPRNTEYEIFSVGGQRHVLGAVFILNHKTVFQRGMPPVAEIARQAHREGALLDLDKHSWPWSMMLVPVADVDLYELSNNSVWRTNFGFRNVSPPPPDYMDVDMDERGMTEWGWLNFGFETYYTLLNCGFRLQPTAGTASGVHPVPLGYSRVYVQTGPQFDAQAWLDGLRQGRSFVTTGPALLAQIEGRPPGHVFQGAGRYQLQIESLSPRPIHHLEIIVNGRLRQRLLPTAAAQQATAGGAFVTSWKTAVAVDRSSWIAVRSFQLRTDRRVRFAHTAPWHVEVGGQPVRPRRREVEFLIRRMQSEIERNRDVLAPEALQEFRTALARYQALAERAVDE